MGPRLPRWRDHRYRHFGCPRQRWFNPTTFVNFWVLLFNRESRTHEARPGHSPDWGGTSGRLGESSRVRRRWRDLAWFLLIFCLIGILARRQSGGANETLRSHQLDGQTYSAERRGYASTWLELDNGRFRLSQHSCTRSGEWSGFYRLAENNLFLDSGPYTGLALRKSAGRFYLDTKSSDYDRSLKLVADAAGGPHPPRWGGKPLRVNGLYPGMNVSELGPRFHVLTQAQNRTIYWSDSRDVVVSAKGGRVLAVGGPRLMEGSDSVLLEYGEKVDWIEECVGQKHRRWKSLAQFPCGLSVGGGAGFFGSYFLGEASEIERLENQMVWVDGIPF